MEALTLFLRSFFVVFLVKFAAVLLLSFGVVWIWKNILLKYAMKTRTNLDQKLLTAGTRGVQLTFIAAGFSFLWNMYGHAIMMSVSFDTVIDMAFIEKVIGHVAFLFLAMSIMYLAWRLISALLDWFQDDIVRKTPSRLDDKVLFSTRKLVKAVFIVVVSMVIADHFELPISKLWAAAGIGSLAIAFAAKDTLANMISGVIILFDRPFLAGDRVELADGTFGDVVDVGLRSTRILSFDNTIHILPNAEISNQRITNHSYPDIHLKVAQKVGVAYGSDMVRVKCIISDILRDNGRVLDEPPWGIWFTEFGDSSLNLFMRYWIADYRSKFDIVDEVNMAINRRFEAEGIEIPFPQRDIHIIDPGQAASEAAPSSPAPGNPEGEIPHG